MPERRLQHVDSGQSVADDSGSTVGSGDHILSHVVCWRHLHGCGNQHKQWPNSFEADVKQQMWFGAEFMVYGMFGHVQGAEMRRC